MGQDSVFIRLGFEKSIMKEQFFLGDESDILPYLFDCFILAVLQFLHDLLHLVQLKLMIQGELGELYVFVDDFLLKQRKICG